MAKSSIPMKTPKPRKEAPTAAELFTPPEFTQTATNPEVIMQPPYICHCTNKSFEDQKGNFFQCNGELWAANNGYFPISRSAIESYYKHILKQFDGDERMAMHRIAQILDLYINDELIEAVLSASEGKTPIGRLVQRSNMKQHAGKTYANTIKELAEAHESALADAMATIEEVKQQAATGAADALAEVEIDDRAIELFGVGLEPDEYPMLLHHYDTLTRQFDSTDAVQQELIKDLCQIKVTQQQAYIRKDMGTYADATKLYQATLKAGGLKARTEDIDMMNEDACWGTFIRDIEQYVPSDIYEDDKLFNDVDETESYFKRMILRPVINFFTGSRKMDEEYSLLPGEGDEYEN